MGAATAIYTLQLDQLRHDEFYHKDIVRLPMADRLQHMALHMAKYSGRLIEALRDSDLTALESTIVDAFIISLATANSLNVDIGRQIGADESDSLKALGLTLSERWKRPADEPFWFAHSFAIETSRLAKACESLDHVEAYPSREVASEAIGRLASLTAAEAAIRQVDLIARVEARLAGVEEKSIFNSSRQSGTSRVSVS